MPQLNNHFGRVKEFSIDWYLTFLLMNLFRVKTEEEGVEMMGGEERVGGAFQNLRKYSRKI